MIVWVLVAAAAVLLLWPAATATKKKDNPYQPAAAQPRLPSYLDAVAALQNVRNRLVETELLGGVEQEAIDAITLALVRGSER